VTVDLGLYCLVSLSTQAPASIGSLVHISLSDARFGIPSLDLIGCIEEIQAALQAAGSLPQNRRLLRVLSLACASLSFYLSLLNAPSAQSFTKSLDISGSIRYDRKNRGGPYRYYVPINVSYFCLAKSKAGKPFLQEGLNHVIPLRPSD
jgi:hypothetical protein